MSLDVIKLRSPATFSTLLVFTTLAPPAFMIAAYTLWPSPPVVIQPGLLAVAFLGGAHVFITFWFYLDGKAHKQVFAVRKAYYYALPIVIMAATSLTYAMLSTPNRMYAYAAFMLSAQWHHSRQNIGVYSFLSQSWKLGPVSQIERNIISLSWLGGVCAGLRWYQFPINRPDILTAIYWVGVACYVVVFAAAGYFALRAYREHRSLLKTGLFLGLCAFFLPALLFTNVAAATSFGAAHSIQYYLFLWYVLYREPSSVASRLRLPTSRLGWITSIGLAGAWPFAVLLGLSYVYMSAASAIGNGFNNTVDAALFGIIMGWVITHYVVDAGIWKMGNKRVREYHSEQFAFLRS
jgi:hypothetical protein